MSANQHHNVVEQKEDHLSGVSLDLAVDSRYSSAAEKPEPGLCCPVDYDSKYLSAIPQEVLEKDYGCGDPVSYVRSGERVLDLGSGSGKVCFIAAQIVGPKGSVIGVDVNDDMLQIARSAGDVFAETIGHRNVTFVKARIEDLALDLDLLDRRLKRHPASSYHDLVTVEALAQQFRRDSPLIETESIDVVISNCVLNLVPPHRKPAMFSEIFRVLRPGGRAVISDIVSSVDVPEEMRADPHLWSGCYSGALQEEQFLLEFSRVGLVGVRTIKREERAWETLDSVDFRSVTVAAHKPLKNDHVSKSLSIYYRGPFSAVTLESGEQLRRGAVTLMTAESDICNILSGAYGDELILADAAGTILDPAAATTCSPGAECC